MYLNESIICPKCKSKNLSIKREATYLYTYQISQNKKESSNKDEALPFLFDNRAKIDSKEYLQCESCGGKYPCKLDEFSGKIDFTILQKAIRADNQETPEFLG
ncbi:hypothetical protein IAI10_16835 [Clostridium sp. 19966]|uniref:hypothetical protein n=1 Tax=Clostridium sp. 19966 TaxID=2768166 RepID=UPI0028DF62E5|nr:hypothetical protein [Clostridium sp. 19966]MDT8718334.1 hypothetical protein [Clostridium sp. 19966]